MPASVKLAASVTMMSGIPEAVMIRPMIVELTIAMTRHAAAMSRQAPRSWPSIQRAAMQLTSTIIAPTDKSMPPEITMMACAMAKKASVIVPAVIVRIWKGPNVGTSELCHSSSTTRSTATPATQPFLRRSRATRLEGSGSDVPDTGLGESSMLMPTPPARARR